MKRILAIFLLLSLLLSGCGNAAPADTRPSAGETPEELKIHFIDVGQGDSILLQYGDDAVLIDGGYPESGIMLLDYLENQGVEELDLVVATHAHGDHVGGLATVLSAYPTGRVWSGTRHYYTNYYEDFLYYADQQNLTVEHPRAGERFFMGDGDVSLQVLGPVADYPLEVNNTSLVIMVQYGENRFLLTGDMEREAELDLINSGADLKADVLKVGHHGSYSSTSYIFLNEVMPTYGVISCGRNNDYGHPHDAPMSRLRDADVTIFRTDEMGTIVAVSDGTDITFTWAITTAQPEGPKAA